MCANTDFRFFEKRLTQVEADALVVGDRVKVIGTFPFIGVVYGKENGISLVLTSQGLKRLDQVGDLVQIWLEKEVRKLKTQIPAKRSDRDPSGADDVDQNQRLVVERHIAPTQADEMIAAAGNKLLSPVEGDILEGEVVVVEVKSIDPDPAITVRCKRGFVGTTLFSNTEPLTDEERRHLDKKSCETPDPFRRR